MGEASFHYFVDCRCDNCGNGELEILDLANTNVTMIRLGEYQGYCYACKITHRVEVLRGNSDLHKRSISWGA
jgi:hypothetical protein